MTAYGQTDLSGPVIEALRWRPELLVIVSDGYDNAPPYGAQEVLRVFRSKLDPEKKTSIVHVNPVYDAADYAPKTLGEAVPTVGLRSAEDLLTMIGFARFAEGTAPLAALEGYLEQRARALVSSLEG